ncbi:MAG: hypothetical protein AAF229_00770 [Pseudomonadota bacterium]
MSALTAVLLGLGAALVAVLVHTLYLGARRRITVATLKPFETESRPRLTTAPLSQRALLVSRLVLFATLVATVVREQPEVLETSGATRVVAVVPGTSPPEIEPGVQYLWLDGQQTPLSRAPQRDDVTAAALLALSQALPADTQLVVAGTPAAMDWPSVMPELGRSVVWQRGDTPARNPGGWESAGAPKTLHIIGDDDALRAAVRQAIGLWREAGFLPDTVTVVDTTIDNSSGARILLGKGAPDHAAWTARVVVFDGVDSAHAVAFDPTLSAGVFATALWHQLTAIAGRRPVDGVAVAPLPGASSRLAPGNIERRLTAPISVAWLVLAVGLFATERTLALRGAQV